MIVKVSISQKIIFQRRLQKTIHQGPIFQALLCQTRPSHWYSFLSVSKNGVLTRTAVSSFRGRHVTRADVIAMVTVSTLCARHHLGIPTHYPIFPRVLIALAALLRWERLSCTTLMTGIPRESPSQRMDSRLWSSL